MCRKGKSDSPSSEVSHLFGEYVSDEDSVNKTTNSKSFKQKKICVVNPDYYYIPEGDFSIVWPNVSIFTIGIIGWFYGFQILLTNLHDDAVVNTWLLSWVIGCIAGFGITAGAHRLWSHRSYKGTLPLRIFLMLMQSMSGQNSLYVWVKDHRIHHKFSETDGDPHNSKRGYFFAHCGWLMKKKHPEVFLQTAKLDFSDLMKDPVVRLQYVHYFKIYWVMAFSIPIVLPVWLWGLSWWRSFIMMYLMRYMTSLHSTWFVNSTAHMFGDRPYNKHIYSTNNSWVSFGSFGEGYHNYHHTFPFDYRTAEDGMKFNLSKLFIDLMAKWGLAFDLKCAAPASIQSRKEKTLSSTKVA